MGGMDERIERLRALAGIQIEGMTSGKLAAQQVGRANNHLDGALDALAQLSGALRAADDTEGHRMAKEAIRKAYSVKAVVKELRHRAFDAQRSGK